MQQVLLALKDSMRQELSRELLAIYLVFLRVFAACTIIPVQGFKGYCETKLRTIPVILKDEPD